MSKTIEQLQNEYNQVFNLLNFDENDLDYTILKKHIEYLEKIDEYCNSIFVIFDLFKKKHLFVSKNAERILHFNLELASSDESYFDLRIHPNDVPLILEAGTYFLRYGLLLPTDEKKDSKLVNEYRLLNGREEYVRVIEQQMCLELDIRGNVWLALGIMDISPEQNVETSFQSRLINIKSKEVFHFPPKTEEDLLTIRETEVLKLIAKGLISKQIADKLFISINTVNTHRQRILEKLNAGNIIEAIHYASMLRII
ncbi:MAG: helix-turn-helix transcriptional regulator [Bacteroidota bacterium]